MSRKINLSGTPRTNSIVTGLLLSLALLVILNLISAFFFYRLDVSKGRIHTLSKTSKKLAKDLKDNVVVKVYLSNNLPPEYNVLARYAKDLLGEYRQFGGRHFRYELVSTANDDEFQGAAARDNIFGQRTMIVENDQQTVRDIYMGLAFEYKGNRESLNLTKAIEGRLEYEITAILRRLTKASLPKVSVYQDSLYSAELYKYFEHHIRQNYQVVPINLTSPFMEADVLIFPGAMDSLSALQMYNLDQYIMHGGKVVFLQDRISGLVQYNEAFPIYSNIFRLLEHYGVFIKPNIVMDQNCAPINVSQRSGIFVIDTPLPYPPIPMLQGIKKNVVSNGLSDMLLYLGSEIDTNAGRTDVTVLPLLKTSPGSGIMAGPQFDISPDRFMQKGSNEGLTLPPITVAAYYTGKFTSLFATNPSIAKTPGFIASNPNAEIIVLSDSDFIRDFITSASDANMMFLLNAVDFLLKDLSLSEVRSRTLPNSPLEISTWLYKRNVPMNRIAEIEPVVRLFVKGVNLVLPSLLLIVCGFIVLISQKKRRRSIQQYFQPLKPTEPEPSVPEQEQHQ